MNRRLAAIEARRANLIERAARERENLAFALQPLSRSLDFVERCAAAGRLVISNPPLLAGAMLVFALLRPRRALNWASRAWGIWRGYRWLTRKIAV